MRDPSVNFYHTSSFTHANSLTHTNSFPPLLYSLGTLAVGGSNVIVPPGEVWVLGLGGIGGQGVEDNPIGIADLGALRRAPRVFVQMSTGAVAKRAKNNQQPRNSQQQVTS